MIHEQFEVHLSPLLKDFDAQLTTVGHPAPGSAVAHFHMATDAHKAAHALNSYDKHLAILDHTQLALSLFDLKTATNIPRGLRDELIKLQKRVDDALVKHHEAVEAWDAL